MVGPLRDEGRRAARVGSVLSRARLYVIGALFQLDEARLSPGRRASLMVARLVFVTADAFFRERLQVRAAALAFFTILSIVPLAATVFSVAKGAGFYDQLVEGTARPFLDEQFRFEHDEGVPEGVQVLHGTLDQILDLVAETDVFGLGLIGFIVLIVTMGRVVALAEESFDAVWGFRGRRRLRVRLPGYLLVALFSPALLVFASTLTAAREGQAAMAFLASWLPFAWLLDVIAFVVPPFLVCLAMLPLYVLLPSARVRRRSAMIGAVVGGLGWYTLQVGHVMFQIGVARNNALYSGFGAFPIFLLWLHLSWVWVLLGAQVAAAHQNAPTLRQLARRTLEDHASRQAVGLRAMIVLARRRKQEHLRKLARDIGVAVEPLREVLDALVEHGLLARADGPYDPVYAPTSDPDSLRVAAVLSALGRGPSEDAAMPWQGADEPLTQVLEGLQLAVESSAHNRTIGELRRASDPRSSEPSG